MEVHNKQSCKNSERKQLQEQEGIDHQEISSKKKNTDECSKGTAKGS